MSEYYCRLDGTGSDCHRLLHVGEFSEAATFSKPSEFRLTLIKLKLMGRTPVTDSSDAVM